MMIDLFSLLLLILTGLMIISMLIFDLQKFKFVYLGVIVLLGIGVYFHGMTYQVENPNYFDIVLRAVGNTSQILRGIFQTPSISGRINADVYFLISAYAIHIIGFGYTYILIFAIFFKNLSLSMRFASIKKHTHSLVLTDSNLGQYVLDSFVDDHAIRVNIAITKKLSQEKTFLSNYPFKPGLNTFDVESQPLSDLLPHQSKGAITFYSLLQSESSTLTLVEKLQAWMIKHPDSHLHAYILVQSSETLKVLETLTHGQSRIHFFSYHQLVARQILFDYPLTSLVPNLINQDLVTLQGKKVNYNFIGFGPTNREIYDHLLVTNQFPPITVAKLFKVEQHPIQYCIFSDEGSEFISDQRFQKPKDDKKIHYFPYPTITSSTQFIHTKLSGSDLIEQFQKQSIQSSHFNIFIIAGQSDIDNLTIAYKVQEYITKNRLQYRVKLFVQVLNETIKEASSLFKNDYTIAFGFGKSMYSSTQITQPVFKQLAQNIHQGLFPDQRFDDLSSFEQETYFFEAIAIRFKLNLMGLDLRLSKRGLSAEEFYKLYDPEMEGVYDQKDLRAKNYSDIQKYKRMGNHKRNLLARQEQLRFSAYRLYTGWKQPSIEDVLAKQKLLDERKKEDVRITTFEGLLDLHTLLHEKLSLTFQAADYIYPLFHTMDHVYDLIASTDYVVVDITNDIKNATLQFEKLVVQDSVQSDIKH